MAELVPVLGEKEIEKIVADMARRISADFQGKEPVAVGVLKGAFVFMADLLRKMTLECRVDFIRVASYGHGTETCGVPRLTGDLKADLAGRPVLLVEDIVDTGLTTAFAREHLLEKGADSVRICAMIDKTGRRKAPVTVDYAGYRVSDGFLVGYGLDHAEKYRGLAGIYALKS